MKKLASLSELEQLRGEIRGKRDPDRKLISICGGTGCIAYGSLNIVDAFKKEITTRDSKTASGSWLPGATDSVSGALWW